MIGTIVVTVCAIGGFAMGIVGWIKSIKHQVTQHSSHRRKRRHHPFRHTPSSGVPQIQ